MKNPCKYLINVFRIIYWKIRYNYKLSIGFIQTFDKIKLDLKGKSNVKIGCFNQNRFNLYIGVNNGDLIIGNHCFFNINCSITCMDKIKIGNFCKFGNNVVIVDHDHNFKTEFPEFISSPIEIGNNVWVGANVTILRGTKIGDNCIIAAGSVVKGEVPSGTTLIDKRTFVSKSVKV